MFIRKEETNNYSLVPVRSFEDMELPLASHEEAALRRLMSDYSEVQLYLQRVYDIQRAGGYAQAQNMEVPKCLRDHAEQSADETPKRPDTEAPLSKTSQTEPSDSESSSTTSQTEAS